VTAALEFQRHGQFHVDFVESENSNGFDAPQEAARILGEAIDYPRQGQLALPTALVSQRDPPGRDAGSFPSWQLPDNVHVREKTWKLAAGGRCHVFRIERIATDRRDDSAVVRSQETPRIA
jgi:hypothetical protein